MATSRDKFLGSAMDKNAERLEEFRRYIEKRRAAAQGRGETSFGAQIPDALLSHPLTGIIAEYEAAGWTVTRSKTGNETTLGFS
jgi:hypothetical protein